MKIFVSFTVLLCLTACGAERNGSSGSKELTSPSKSADEPGGEDRMDTAAIANPASVHCLKSNGKLEMMDDPNGEFGVCVFSDGSRCEEWRLFRKECAIGQCRESNGICKKTQ